MPLRLVELLVYICLFSFLCVVQKYDWTSNEQSAQEFLDCIVNFVTYNGCYIPACFQILVQGFIPKKSNKDAGTCHFYSLLLISLYLHNTTRV